MRIGWLLGWAVPIPWFSAQAVTAFPDAAHSFFAPGPGALGQLGAAGPFDWVAGYSLGTLLLLSAPPTPAVAPRVALLAPIFAFPRESGRGGRVPGKQVSQLGRSLRRDPGAALQGFYKTAGLDIVADPAAAGDPSALAWGLERLEHDDVRTPMPAGWLAWCGSEDALLDADELHAIDARVKIVPGAGHHPAGLLRAFARDAS